MGMKILLFLSFTFCTLTLPGQDYLLDKYETTYFHHRKEYTWKELGDVYFESEKAFRIYSSGRNNLVSAKNFAKNGAFILGVGLSTLIIGPDSVKLIYGSVIAASGILVEFGALIYLVSGKNKLRKARTVFNFEMLERHGFDKGMSLVFGVSGNGAGLSLQF